MQFWSGKRKLHARSARILLSYIFWMCQLGCYVFTRQELAWAGIPGKDAPAWPARMSPSALESTTHIANMEGGEKKHNRNINDGLSVYHMGRNLRKPVSRRPAMRDTTKQKKMAPANPPIWYASLSASSPGVMGFRSMLGEG